MVTTKYEIYPLHRQQFDDEKLLKIVYSGVRQANRSNLRGPKDSRRGG